MPRRSPVAGHGCPAERGWVGKLRFAGAIETAMKGVGSTAKRAALIATWVPTPTRGSLAKMEPSPCSMAQASESYGAAHRLRARGWPRTNAARLLAGGQDAGRTVPLCGAAGLAQKR